MPRLDLFINEMVDEYIRENFEKIADHFNDTLIMSGFEGKHFELEFTGAVTNYRTGHGLIRVPKDAWLTYMSPDSDVTLTFNYDEFDDTYIDITIADPTVVLSADNPCTVRFFAGTWREE